MADLEREAKRKRVREKAEAKRKSKKKPRTTKQSIEMSKRNTKAGAYATKQARLSRKSQLDPKPTRHSARKRPAAHERVVIEDENNVDNQENDTAGEQVELKEESEPSTADSILSALQSGKKLKSADDIAELLQRFGNKPSAPSTPVTPAPVCVYILFVHVCRCSYVYVCLYVTFSTYMCNVSGPTTTTGKTCQTA
jgi:hypothetical protein